MPVQFKDIINATKELIQKYPEIKGTYYSLFFWKPGDRIRNIFFNFLKDILLPRQKLPLIEEKIWYLIHGELPSNYLNLQSITEELKKNGFNGKILCYKSKALKNIAFAWEKVDIKRPSVYLKKKELIKLFQRAKKLAFDYDNSLKDYSLKNSTIFPDKRFLESNLYLILKFDYLAEILLHTYKPEIIISGVNTGYFINPIFRHSNKNGILTISIQHGEIGDYEDIEECSYFLCWGDYYKEKIEKKGISGDKLISIGSPRFDNILKNLEDKSVLRKKYGYEAEDKILLHISDGNFGKDYCPDYPEILLKKQKEDFEKLFSELSEKFKIIVKLHPGEERKYWDCLNKLNNFKIFNNNYDIYELIQISDIISTVASIAGFEASILGKPVIYYAPEGVNLVDYPEKGLGFKVRNSKEWIGLAEKLIEDDNFYNNAIKDMEERKNYFISNLGNSSRKIADFIIKKLNEQ